MSRFAQDLHRLVNNTHHDRLNAMRKGFFKGALMGIALGYMLETFKPMPIPWGLTFVLMVIVSVLKSYFDREAVIRNHLINNPELYDPRLLSLLRDSVCPVFSPTEENAIARFAIDPETSIYEKQLLKSLSNGIVDKIDRLQQNSPRPIPRTPFPARR